MPPQIGSANYSGEVREDGGEGNFLTRKIGPLPMWVYIAGAVIIVYALWVKLQGGRSSSSSTDNPLVTTQPTDTTPYNNLSAALSQILGNEQAIGSSLASQASGNNTPGTTITGAAQDNAAQASYQIQTGQNGMPYTATSQAIVAKTGPAGQSDSSQGVVTPAFPAFLNPRTPTPIPTVSTPKTIVQPAWTLPGIGVIGTRTVPQSPGVQIGRPLRTGPQSF